MPSLKLNPSRSASLPSPLPGHHGKSFETNPPTDVKCLENPSRSSSASFPPPCLMPNPERSTSSHGASPPPGWQEWIAGLLEEHQRVIRADLAKQLQPIRDQVENISMFAEKDEFRGRAAPDGAVCELHPVAAKLHEETCVVPKASKVSMKLSRMTQTDAEEHQADTNLVKSTLRKEIEPTSSFEKQQHRASNAAHRVHYLDVAASWVIISNVITMLVELEYHTYLSKVKLGQRHAGEWNGAQQWFGIVEHTFNGVFILEIILRFWIVRFDYFKQKLNIFDLSLVLMTSVQLYILNPLSVQSGAQLTLFRVFRFVRFVRILKFLRLKTFSALRILVHTCLSSMLALTWSMVLLFLIIIMSGVFLCNLLKDPIQDDSTSIEFRNWLFRYYGSVWRAIYTLFEVTLAGCWPTYFRPLIEKVSAWYALFVIIYINVVVFAVIRIITAIFLKQTLNAADSDADMVVIEQKAMMDKTLRKVKDIFEHLDTSGDGLLGEEEFQMIVENADVQSWLSQLDVSLHDVEGLFSMLDDGDGKITYDEFLAGMLRLKGQARSLDVVALRHHCDHIEDVVVSVEAKLDRMTAAFAAMRLQSSKAMRL